MLEDKSQKSYVWDALDFLSESYLGAQYRCTSYVITDSLTLPFIVTAFMFWTSLTGLHPEIFFFSVYNMGVGGHEALLVIQLMALGVALLPPIRRWLLGGGGPRMTASASGNKGKASTSSDAHVGRLRLDVMTAVYLFCVVGFAVWPVEDALIRLIATALSCVGFSFLTALDWGRAWETNTMEGKAAVWMTGLLLSSLAKYANHSNNPAWSFLHGSNGGHNSIALLLAMTAIAERLWAIKQRQKSKLEPYKQRKAVSTGVAAAGVCGLGALVFGIHVLLTDSGTLIAWTWTGYPNTGPSALLHGRLILLASALSAIAALHYPTLSLEPVFWIFGSVSLFLVWAYEDWLGFAGALGVAAFLPPLALPLLQLAMHGHPLKSMWLVWLVTDVMAFLQVLTAAYAFVPGGKIMREHTGLMMVVMLLFLLAGLSAARKHLLQDLQKHRPKRIRMIGSFVLASIAGVAQVVPLMRGADPSSIVPHYPADRVFTAGIWTVHFSLDQSMWDSTRRMANLIKEMKLDIVGLLETDLHRTVFGNRDLTQYLGESLNMHVDMGPGPDKHTWGAALLSKFPIINSTHHLLPSPNGELAPAIHAVLDIFGVATHVVVSHNGQEEDPLDRELQTKKLASILSDAYPHPAIFLGYVVTKPHARRPNPYEILFSDGRMVDVDPADMDRWCEYIGFRALERVGYVRVSRYTVTDTEMQTAKFRIPPVDAPQIDPDRDVLMHKTMRHPGEHLPWTYPLKFIDPPAMVYE